MNELEEKSMEMIQSEIYKEQKTKMWTLHITKE